MRSPSYKPVYPKIALLIALFAMLGAFGLWTHIEEHLWSIGTKSK